MSFQKELCVIGRSANNCINLKANDLPLIMVGSFFFPMNIFLRVRNLIDTPTIINVRYADSNEQTYVDSFQSIDLYFQKALRISVENESYFCYEITVSASLTS